MPATLISIGNGPIALAGDDRPATSGAAMMVGRQESGCCQFTTYRAERVSVTSSLWSGGDWHWRLVGPSGAVLADCGGYFRESDCLAVIQALRTNAQGARLPLHH